MFRVANIRLKWNTKNREKNFLHFVVAIKKFSSIAELN